MNNHTISVEIKFGFNSQGFFSYNNPEELIVFIHGFGGNSIGTWNNFPKFLLSDSKFTNTDIIFYGYETLKGQAGEHSAQLYDFVNHLQTPLKSNILPKEQNLPERNYSKIVLVAHSLGAILTRQTLLLAEIDNKGWVDKVIMGLFAPAHNGANIINLAMQSLNGLSGLLGVFAKFRYPILSDLDNHEQGIIHDIKSKTEFLQNQGKAEYTKAKLVVYAMGDKVVRNIQYLNDIPAVVISPANHVSVCKPTEDFKKPIELLKSIL
jgi:Putative serine esterase (DUF676)